MNGFDNPMRDAKTEEVKRHIGEGAKVRMDEKGNIHIKRVSKTNIYIKNTADENSIGNDILKIPQGALEFGKGFLVSGFTSLCAPPMLRVAMETESLFSSPRRRDTLAKKNSFIGPRIHLAKEILQVLPIT